MWPKPSQLIWILNSECIQGLEIRMNDKGSLGFILPLLVVASSAQGWRANQGIFLLHDCDSPECCLSSISSFFLLLGTWYSFISWLPCGRVEPYDQLWPMNWAGSDERSFRAEDLIGLVRTSRVIFSFWYGHWQGLYQPGALSNYIEQRSSVNPKWICGLSKK